MDIKGEAEDRYGTPFDGGRAETAMRMGFTAGAEWAQQEALREVTKALGALQVNYGPARMSRLFHVSDVYQAIRSLEEAAQA